MRILFKTILALIILAIVGLIAVPFLVDPNDYKQEISEQVEKATGRTLTLEGDIGLSVFPWVALELGPLSLSNAKGFHADTFAKVNAVEIRIKLMPLLQKQLEMDTVILDGLVLNLETNKAGKTNWGDLVKSDSKPVEKEAASSATAPALAGISVAGVNLSNANILWEDASKSESYSLNNLNLSTDPLVPGKATAVEMAFDIISEKPQAKSHIALQTKVMVNLESQQYALTNLNLTTQAEGQELPFSKAELSLNGDINADMVKQLVTVDNLLFAIKANKEQQLIDATLSTAVSANLANQQISLKAVDFSAEITDPALPGGKTKLNLTTDITTDMQQQTLSLSALVLEVQDLILNGDINVSKLLSDNPNVAGNINVKPFNARQLAKSLAIELPIMADDSTLELIELNTEFTGSSQHFNAKQLNMTLDQSKLSGHLAVNNFSKPAIQFKLALDDIDVDRYLPSATEEKQATAPPAATAAAGASELPLEAIRQLNAKGTLDIGKLKVSGTHSENIHIEINSADGVVKLDPMSANMYQGQYNGSTHLDASGKTLKLAINENLKGVQVGSLLKDLTGDDKLSGVANFQASLTGNGATVDQIKQTLSGNGDFSFTDGALKGINVAESIRKAKAALSGQTLPPSGEPIQTDFSSLTGSFTATNGIIDNQDLQVASPLLRIDGAGLVDLPKEGIDYGLKVSIVSTIAGQGGEDLSELKGLTIPIKITGTFNDPKPTVDLASMFKQQATDKAKEAIADKLKEQVGDDLGGLVGGLLGTDTAKPETTPTKSTTEAEQQEPAPAKAPEEQVEDALKDKLKSFF